jgi:DNA polymerase-3 subunit delta
LRFGGKELDKALAGRLRPVIALFGAEPLSIEESADVVRARLRERGFTERLRYSGEPGLDWGEIAYHARNSSLFSDRRLIEIRFPAGRPDERIAVPALVELMREPAADSLLLFLAGALDRRAQGSAWFTRADEIGWVVEHPVLAPEKLPGWIAERLARLGRRAEPAAVETLCRLFEGNLLALEQELRKLALLSGEQPLTVADVEASASDSARYSVGALSDACLQGDGVQALRILGSLRAEGDEPVLLLTVLTREIRQLARLAALLGRGMSLAAAFAAQRVWRTREPVLKKALAQRDAEFWSALLKRMAHLDRVLKGRASGNIWDELEQVCAVCGGADVFLRQSWAKQT